MAIELNLKAMPEPGSDLDNADPEEWLDAIGDWLKRCAGEPLEGIERSEDGLGRPKLLVKMHPAGEDFFVYAYDSGPIAIVARTSQIGPGYHVYLSDLCHRMARDLKLRWTEIKDNGRYFRGGDSDALEHEMLRWISTLASFAIDKMKDDFESLMLAMPIERRFPHYRKAAITALGPRDSEWLTAVANQPALGKEFFSWWSPELNAAFRRNRALVRMWQDVRWRKPISREEARLLKIIHVDLASAFAEEPDLALPWREWAEIVGYLRADDESAFAQIVSPTLESAILAKALAHHDDPEMKVGYRRRTIKAHLPKGWMIEIPGEMAESLKDNEWTAWDGVRTITVRIKPILNFNKTPREILDGLALPKGELFEVRRGHIIGKAAYAVQREGGRRTWRLTGRTVYEGTIAVCEIFSPNQSDRDWSAAAWRTLENGIV